jgi:hypothetical protein
MDGLRPARAYMYRLHACLGKYQSPIPLSRPHACLATTLSRAFLPLLFSRSRVPPSLLLPSLSCYGAGERPNATASARAGHDVEARVALDTVA